MKTFSHYPLWLVALLAHAPAPALGALDGLSGDLLVEAMIDDCRHASSAQHRQGPDGVSYDFLCEDGVPKKIRRLDESSRERLAYELLPSLLDGQLLLRPVSAPSPCKGAARGRRVAAQIGWGKLSATCSGGKLEGKFTYRVGESTEEEGAFHLGVLDGDYVQYQRMPIGMHSPQRREAHRASYHNGALDGVMRDSDANGAYLELSFHDGVLHGPRRAGKRDASHETIDSEVNYADGRVHGPKRSGSSVSTYQNGVLQSTNDPAERAASRVQTETDTDGGFFLESAHALALPCPAPAPTPPFAGGGDHADYKCDGTRPEGKVRVFEGGFLRYEANVQSGRLDGPFRSYLAGALQTEGAFQSGKADGVFKRYDQGMLLAEKKFDAGKPDKKTIWHGPIPAEPRARRGSTLLGLRAGCDDGLVDFCLRGGEAARAEGYVSLAEPFFSRACELKNGLGCAYAADGAYRGMDFAHASETIRKARKLLSEDELVRRLAEEHHLDRLSTRGALINVLLPGCQEPGPGRCGRLGAKTNREGIHQHETLRRIRAARTRQVASLDVEKALVARAGTNWRCHAGDRVRLAVFRCAWPAPLDWHGTAQSNGLTEGATCLTAGLSLGDALDSVTVVAEHETLAKLPPLFPEEKPEDLWRTATVLGCDETLHPARPIAVLD